MNRLALLALVFVSSLAVAQAPQRIRGTITSLSGDSLMVKTREGRDAALQLPAHPLIDELVRVLAAVEQDA